MTRILIVTAILSALALAQHPVGVDGVISKSTVHRVDISSCDEVEISAPLHELDIEQGMYHAYWFKQYADISRLKITCTRKGDK